MASTLLALALVAFVISTASVSANDFPPPVYASPPWTTPAYPPSDASPPVPLIESSSPPPNIESSSPPPVIESSSPPPVIESSSPPPNIESSSPPPIIRSPPPPSPSPPRPPSPPPPVLAGNTVTTTGFLRFFGPVSTGCLVTQRVPGSTPVNVTNSISSTISPRGLTEIFVAAPAACTDLWTGLALSFPPSANSPATGTFAINAVTSIGFARDGYTAGTVSYNLLSNAKWSLSTESTLVDAIATLRNGSSNYQAVQYTLATDISWIGFSSMVSAAFLATPAPLPAACNTPASIQAVLNLQVAAFTTPLDLTSLAAVTAAVRELGTTCGFSVANINTVAPALGTATVALSTAISPDGANITGIFNSPWPLQRIILMAKVAKLAASAGTGTIASLSASNATQIQTLANSLDVPYAAIASSFGFTNTATSNLALVVKFTGILNAPAGLKITPVSSLTPTTSAALSRGIVTISGATHSIITVPAGSIDLVLSNANGSNPVRTQFDLVAAVPYGAVRLMITPMSNLAIQVWAARQQAFGPSMPSEADYKMAYETIIGSSSTGFSYSEGTVTPFSAEALANFAAETLVAAIPGIGSLLLTGILNTTAVSGSDVAMSLYKLQVGKNSAWYNDASNCASSLLTAYTQQRDRIAKRRSPSSGRRQLLDAAAVNAALEAQLTAIFAKVATAISNTNIAANNVLVAAKAAIANNDNTPSAASFATLASVASVQSGAIAQEIQAIAVATAAAVAQIDAYNALVAAGGNPPEPDVAATFMAAANLAAAAEAANTVDKLTSQITEAAKSIDLGALAETGKTGNTLAGGPAPSFEDSSSSTNKPLIIGLVVGLVGAAALIAALAVVIIRRKRMHSVQPEASHVARPEPAAAWVPLAQDPSPA